MSIGIGNPLHGVSIFRHGSQVTNRERMPHIQEPHNPALDRAPFGRWTLRDKAAQRRSALR